MTGIDLLEQLIRRSNDDMASEFKLHPDHPAVSVENNQGVYFYFVDDTEVSCSEAIETLEAAYEYRQTSFGLKRKAS